MSHEMSTWGGQVTQSRGLFKLPEDKKNKLSSSDASNIYIPSAQGDRESLIYTQVNVT